jgi:predicted PurR-regulated permease PerM
MALANGLAALLLGVPATGAIAVVKVIGAYIPYVGAFIGGAFAVLMGLGEGGIGLALIMLGITLVVNLLLENLLEPALLAIRSTCTRCSRCSPLRSARSSPAWSG